MPMEKIPKKYDNMHHIHINKHEYELIKIRIPVINACYQLVYPQINMFGSLKFKRAIKNNHVLSALELVH